MTTPRVVNTLSVVTLSAGLLLVGPLEHASGMALGLGWWHALTITATVEGFTALAVLAGRLVPLALTLTTGSTLVGMLRTALDHRGALDQFTVGAAVATTALAVAALAGTHHVRRQASAEVVRAAQLAEQAAVALEQVADEREQARQRAADDEALRVRASRAAEQAAARRHELELERLAADRERGRLYLEQERADREQERADRERERATAERQQAAAEHLAEQNRVRAERERLVVEQEQAEAERLRTDRGAAYVHWADREEERPMTTAEVAAMLGVTAGRARAQIADWRTDRRGLHAVEST